MEIISDATITVTPSPAPARDALADRLAWLNDHDGNTIEDYPGPGWDVDGYVPTDEEAAELLGFELGLAGEPMPEDRRFTLGPREFVAMVCGYGVGRHTRQERAWREEIEYNAWLDELAREREAELRLEDGRGWADAERIEAIGCINARKAD